MDEMIAKNSRLLHQARTFSGSKELLAADKLPQSEDRYSSLFSGNNRKRNEKAEKMHVSADASRQAS